MAESGDSLGGGVVHGTVVLVDLAGAGAQRNDASVRQRQRDALSWFLLEAFRAAGVPWSEVVHEGLGDGELMFVPDRFPAEALLGPMLSRLLDLLRTYNRDVPDDARIRLRVALHVGFVLQHAAGRSGSTVVEAARLLGSAELKQVQADTGAELALITSDLLYEDAVRHGRMGIDPDAFHEVTVAAKEFRARAWIGLFRPAAELKKAQIAAAVRRVRSRRSTGSAKGGAVRETQSADEAMVGVEGDRPVAAHGADGVAFHGDVHVGNVVPAGSAPARPMPPDHGVGAEPSDDSDTDERPGGLPPGRYVARFLSGYLPARVPRGAEVSLVVRVVADERAGDGVRTVALRKLAMDADGASVTVIVQAHRGLASLDRTSQQVIHVPPEGDSDPVRFAFRAEHVGLQSVRVTAWAGGTFLAELELELSIEEHAPYVNTEPRRTPLPSTAPNAGEATLQVLFDGRHYTFQLLSDAYLFAPVVTESLAAEPGDAVERTIGMLRQLATATTPYSGANARRRLVEAGVGLWNDMVPAAIKEQFWALGDHVSAFSIADDRGVIPWELLYPKAKGHDDGFLVERFPVLRRVYGQQRHDGLMHGRPRFVAPDGGPANAREEIAAIRALFGDDGDDIIGDLGELMDLIDSGDAGALHFACHNAHDAARGSEITMAGGPLVPDLLNSAASARSLESRRPLVFLNACRSAGVSMRYLKPTGWAKQFMTAGAGAFVGTLWAVRSDSATRFARPFYEALRAGEPLGEASRIARTTARDDRDSRDEGDPSWLAYTVYGNPTARVRG